MSQVTARDVLSVCTEQELEVTVRLSDFITARDNLTPSLSQVCAPSETTYAHSVPQKMQSLFLQSPTPHLLMLFISVGARPLQAAAEPVLVHKEDCLIKILLGPNTILYFCFGKSH